MPEITYIDFDLLILPVAAGFQARVLASPAGEANCIFQQPFTAQELALFQAGVARGARHLGIETTSNGTDLETIKTLGGKLFNAVFQGEVLKCLHVSLYEAERNNNVGLRIRLRLNEVPALAQIPWEYLYQSDLNRFLVTSNKTPVVRYLEMSETIPSITVTAPLRVLVMISEPQERPLDVETEWQGLQQALGGLEKQGLLKLDRIPATLKALQDALQNGYHVLHFIGHGGFTTGQSEGQEGEQDGLLLFETQQERHEITGQQLGALLHDAHLSLVLLNACEGARASGSNPFSGVAQHLMQQGVAAVIAMQDKITDQAAIEFSYSFYQAIAAGDAIDTALAAARKALFAVGNNLEWGIPVLHMRDSDARLFKLKPREVEPDKLLRVGDYLRPQTNMPAPAAHVPVALPQFIAREQQWQALEQAWTAGQAVLLVGEHGLGKSRLIQEFASSKGKFVMVRAIVLEANDPNATLTRILYELLAHQPDLEIEHWVTQELARIMPEFGAAPSTQNDKPRFLRAIDWLFERLLNSDTTFILEDLDLADNASLEVLLHALRRFWGQTSTRICCTFSELPEGISNLLLESVNARKATIIELDPFTPTEITAFLQHLQQPKLEPEQITAFATMLEQAKQANPGNILESLNLWVAAGAQGPLQDQQQTIALMRQQFKQLSDDAQLLAACFALIGVDLNLAGKVLETNPLKLSKSMGELKDAKLISNAEFANDWVRDVVLEETDDAIEVYMHQMSAQALESMGGRPAVIAMHWQAANDPVRAAPQWRKAAEAAETTFQFVEGAKLYKQASEAFAQAQIPEQQTKMLKKQSELTFHFAPKACEEILDQMLALVNTPFRIAGTLQAKAEYYYRVGNAAEAEKAALKGCEQAELSGDLQQRTTLLIMLGVAYWMQMRLTDAIKTYNKALEVCELWGDLEAKGTLLMNLGLVHSLKNQYTESSHQYEQAIQIFAQLKDDIRQADVYTNMGASLREQGKAQAALVPLQSAMKIYQTTNGKDNERRVLTQLAEAYRDLAEYKTAMECISKALEIVLETGVSQARIREVRGHILMFLGDFEQAQTDLDQAFELANNDDMRARVLFKKIRLWEWLDREPKAIFDVAKKHMQKTEDQSLLFQCLLFEGMAKPSITGLKQLQKALKLTQKSNLGGLEIIARSQLAQRLLGLSQFAEALKYSQTAIQMFKDLSPTGSYIGEVMWVNVMILQGLNDTKATKQLKKTRAWVQNVAENQTPLENREGFLFKNVTNRAILNANNADLIPS
jgi:tetratricopeptide (TPR) repeat protein